MIPAIQVEHVAKRYFCMVDGFRYGFFGVGDVAPWFSATIVAAALLALSSLAAWLIKTGYKLRH